MGQKKNARAKAQPAGRKPVPGSGELRIIGGDWRSRRLRFPDAGGVRPTPARTRETLFNWLAYQVVGSQCLDLFAGSGALGLEALSRGAARATLVDHTPALARALKDNLKALKTERGTVVCQSVDLFLSRPASSPVDILFMDPPFRQGWLDKLFPLIETNQWLRPGSWLYVEHESELSTPATPACWELYRQKTAGQVTYSLFRVGAGNADADTDHSL